MGGGTLVPLGYENKPSHTTWLMERERGGRRALAVPR